MRVIIEGDKDKIDVIKRRFRGFGVKFIDDGGTVTADTVCNDMSHASLSLENDHLKESLESANAEIELLKAKPIEPDEEQINLTGSTETGSSTEAISEQSEEVAPIPVQKPKGKSKK